MPSRRVRLPLQTGSSATGAVLASLVGGIPLVLVIGVAGRTLGSAVVAGPLGIAMFGTLTYLLLRVASQRQASDALLDAGGLTIENGPANGLTVPWSDVEPDASKIDIRTDPKRPDDPSPTVDMFLFRKSAEAVCVASTADPDERVSIEAVLACVRAKCSGEAPPVRRREVEVLACTGCGAVAVPADVAVVTCRFCGRPVAVPDEVRTRIRASRDLLSSPDAELAERLVSQPGAARVNRTLRTGVVLFYVAAPIALLLGSEIGAVVAFAVLLGSVALARTFVADRLALRSLVLGFGAHGPARDGAPETCRVCSAPLPALASEDRALVHCPFCNAMNLSGIDLRADAVVARSAELELRSALVARSHRRRTAYVGLAVSLAVLGAACSGAYVFTMRRF